MEIQNEIIRQKNHSISLDVYDFYTYLDIFHDINSFS